MIVSSSRGVHYKLLTSDPNGTAYTVTTYDVLGRIASVTNPYYSGGAVNTTTYSYDALGRKTSITDPDGSKSSVSYSGAWSEFQDEGNGAKSVSRIYQHDGLGRLTTVCEVSSASQQSVSPVNCGAFNATGFITTYGYSAIGNLISVTQGSESRSYVYDGVSRLTKETNPEASAANNVYPTTYTYDATGQQPDLYQRVAPLPNQTGSTTVTTTYSHDALHRLTSKTYSDGTTATANYSYDQSTPCGNQSTNCLGRLSAESRTGSSATFTYDKMGRVLLNSQSVPTQYNLNYGYNYLGDWTSSTNGMGTTLTYGYNTAAELTTLTSSLNDVNHPPDLFAAGTFDALGALTADNLGNGSEALTYDTRGRLKTVATIGPDPGNNTPGKGSVSIGGAEQSILTTATGSVTISGSEKSTQFGCPLHCATTYDMGTVTVTIGGYSNQITYWELGGDPYTPTTIAAALVTAINADSHDLVTATQSGATITLTSELAGSGGNYSLSASVVDSDPAEFNPPSFAATASGSALTGGTSTYDSGTVSATVGGHEETVNYSQSDTPTTIATNLTAKFNGDSGSLVTATASGSSVDLTSKAGGSGSNYTLTASVTFNSSKFSHASFSATPSGAYLTGGENGEGTIYNLSLGYAPNGDITSANDTVNGNWTYAYDDFNRLITSKLGSATLSEVYDRYGNRWQQNGSGSGSSSWDLPQYSFDLHNHITGYSYDAAGNQTQDALHTYFYDGENRLIQVDGTKGTCSTATACYIYDAEGRRAGKTLGASTVYYLFDLNQKEVAEVSSAGVWNRGEVYAGNRHLVTYSGGADGVTYFTAADWLGTERMRTGLTSIIETCTSLPFGDSQTCSGSETSPLHFTGQHFDSESSLTRMLFRQHSMTEGRWTSMDPAGKSATDPSNPESWNLYAYVMNNPLRLVDPTGLLGEGQQYTGGTPTSSECTPDGSGGCTIKVDVSRPFVKAQNTSTLQKAENAVDIFNSTLGFGRSDCGGGGSCLNALGMAGTAVIAAVASGGESEGAFVEKQIATAGPKIENIAAKLTGETLEAASREINGGMKVAKAGGGFFDHVGSVQEGINGLNKQAAHLERVLQRSGLSESHVQTINGLIERARGVAAVALRAITPKDPI